MSSTFYVKYHFTAETIYEDIEIENLKVKVTYADEACVQTNASNANPVVSEPLWRDCLREKETTLSTDEIQSVSSLIEQSNFMNLESVYGDKERLRYYPYQIKVKLGETEKEVTYRSTPEAPPMPEAFKQVRETLLGIFKQVVQDSSIASNPV